MEIYMDHAATTRLSPAALEAMMPCFQEIYGNPSSLHRLGRQAKCRLEQARAQVAGCLGASAREIYFTSGGTEADNQAIRTAAALGAQQGKKHIITTGFEHHAVLHTLEVLEKSGFTVTRLPLDTQTHNLDPHRLEQAIRPDTCLVTAMYANNEIGSILPVSQIGKICHMHNILFHVDGVQAAGHIPVNVQQDGVDLLSISGHKFGGPKGIGALYAKKGLQLEKLLEGGGQERGKRPGTENLPAICGMAAALQDACSHLEQTGPWVAELRDRMIRGLSRIPGALSNGDPGHRLPGIVSFCFPGVSGESLLILLDESGICASGGSACSSGSLEPSHVLLAVGRSPDQARSSVRFSLGAENTREEVDYAVEKTAGIVAGLLKDS